MPRRHAGASGQLPWHSSRIVVRAMVDSPGQGRKSAFFELIDALDEALLDSRRWQTVRTTLIRLLPLEPDEIPVAFPDPTDLNHLRQLIATRTWSGSDRDLLRFACLRLERAISLRRRMATSQLRARAATHALEYLSRGVVIVDRTATVLMANAVADGMLRERDGLLLRDGHLAGMTGSYDAQIRRCVIEIADGKSPCVVMPIRRPSLRRTFTMLFTPAKAMLRAEDADDLVLVFINDPEIKVSLDATTLFTTYGLTRSEANLARCLLNGKNLEQAAEELSITSNTARTHLKRIFMKTDTNRQSQLMLLLMTNAVAIEQSAMLPVHISGNRVAARQSICATQILTS